MLQTRESLSENREAMKRKFEASSRECHINVRVFITEPCGVCPLIKKGLRNRQLDMIQFHTAAVIPEYDFHDKC